MLTSSDQAFERLASGFLARYLELNPSLATILGEHRHDARWPDLSAEGLRTERDFLVKTQEELGRIEVKSLGIQNRIDYAILSNQLGLALLVHDELRPTRNDPMYYSSLIGDGLDPLLSRNFAPFETRMASLRARLDSLAPIVKAAKTNLQHPSRVTTETAIQQNAGLIDLVKNRLADEFRKVPGQRLALEQAATNASAALVDFDRFLRSELLGRSDGDFRLGRAAFEKKLHYVLETDESTDSIYRGAQSLLSQTQREMAKTAVALWPELFPGEPVPSPDGADKMRIIKKALDKMAEDHPSNATIVSELTKLTNDAATFVRQHRLVTIPNEPLQVIEMPEYRRGVAIAYCDSSGPLETKRETFFAIAPTPSDWTKERVESFYREYNRAMLTDLVVHEAMPGHFLQIAHGNQFKSPVRSIFQSGPFQEGWAVYTEWFMNQHGFGGLRTKLQREKMVLRLAVNAILDHDIHAGAMTEKQAMDLMTTQAFQEDGEAAGKWRRAQLTSAQLTTYFHGFTEFMRSRERAEKTPGFNEQTYHDKLLSFGTPAPKYIRHLVFGDPIQ